MYEADALDSYDSAWLDDGSDDAGSIFSSIGSAIGSVVSAPVKAAVSVAKTVNPLNIASHIPVVGGVVKPFANLAQSPLNVVGGIASGGNVFSTIKNQVTADLQSVKQALPIAASIIAFVPGVGTGVAAALSAASALANGQSITDAVIAAGRGAIPGGAIAQSAFDVGVGLVKGKNITQSALEAARKQIPGGAAAQAAFDVAVAMAQGQNIQTAAKNAAVKAAGSALSKLGASKMSALSPLATGVFGNVGPKFIGSLPSNAVSLVSGNVNTVAQALLKNPSLRSLPVATLASKLGINQNDVKAGMASVVQAVAKSATSGGKLPGLAPAFDIANKLGAAHSLDKAMSAFASHAAPMAFSPNAVSKAASLAKMPLFGRGRKEVRWTKLPNGLLSQVIMKANDATGLDSTGLKYIVEKGDTLSSIAKKLTGNANRYTEIVKANPSIKDPNKIQIGQVFVLPSSWVKTPTTSSPVVPSASVVAPAPSVVPVSTSASPVKTTYVVAKGDTMSLIAKSYTGNAARWPELAKANPQVKDPNLIYVGQVLTLPDGWGPKPATPTAPPVTTPPLGGPIGQIASTVGQVLSPIAAAATQAAQQAGIPLPSPASLPSLPSTQPTMSEVPLPTASSPIADIITATSAPVSSSPATPIPLSTTTMTPDGPVTATTPSGSSTTTVSQPPITEPKKDNTGLIVLALAAGAIFLVGSGSSK